MSENYSIRLSRLREELRHTEALLRSPRLSSTARQVLEALKRDLERQIQSEEREQHGSAAAD
jgi:hypothetical protein